MVVCTNERGKRENYPPVLSHSRGMSRLGWQERRREAGSLMAESDGIVFEPDSRMFVTS